MDLSNLFQIDFPDYDIIYEGEVVSIPNKNKPYRDDSEKKSWTIKVRPEIPTNFNGKNYFINGRGREVIYYGWSDYGDLSIQPGKKYRFLLSEGKGEKGGWWWLEGKDKLIPSYLDDIHFNKLLLELFAKTNDLSILENEELYNSGKTKITDQNPYHKWLKIFQTLCVKMAISESELKTIYLRKNEKNKLRAQEKG